MYFKRLAISLTVIVQGGFGVFDETETLPEKLNGLIRAILCLQHSQ